MRETKCCLSHTQSAKVSVECTVPNQSAVGALEVSGVLGRFLLHRPPCQYDAVGNLDPDIVEEFKETN